MVGGTGMPRTPEAAIRWTLAAPLMVAEWWLGLVLDELLAPVDYSPFEQEVAS